jgi:hypothetical protein
METHTASTEFSVHFLACPRKRTKRRAHLVCSNIGQLRFCFGKLYDALRLDKVFKPSQFTAQTYHKQGAQFKK